MPTPQLLRHRIYAAAAGCLLATALTGCQATGTTGSEPAGNSAGATGSSGVASAKAPLAPVLDPITGEPIRGDGFSAYYGMWQVRFNSGADAAQFASLPKNKRAQMAAPQVLAAKGIANTVCPLTGEKLTAAAAPVSYEGAVIGFASVADANQFKSLPKPKQAELISKWKASGAT